LLAVLIISCLCLVPEQSLAILGAELLLVGIMLWLATLKLDLSILDKTPKEYKNRYKYIIVFTQFAVLPYIIAGIATICVGCNGVYWLIPAIIFSFSKAVLDAWVMLVEIHR